MQHVSGEPVRPAVIWLHVAVITPLLPEVSLRLKIVERGKAYNNTSSCIRRVVSDAGMSWFSCRSVRGRVCQIK